MREIIVERSSEILRIAIRHKGKLQEIIVEEEKNGPIAGEIYKGRIRNIVGATNSVFVDIGSDKDVYLYYSNELKKQNIKKGDEVIAEIVKEPLGEKGAKATTNYALPSKNLILESKGQGIEFSKRFKDEVKKEIISAELGEIDGAKLIVRTNASDVSIDELLYERKILEEEYLEIKRKEKYSGKIGKVYGDNLALSKVLRDKIDLEPTRVIVDTEEDYEFARAYLKNQDNVKIVLFDEEIGIFDNYDIDRELIKLRHNKVVLPCGGSIIIEKTEAMYVIDVNSGRNIKERNFEKTILETNLEAAREIGKQILLRNLSGIIVIDFIDPREKAHKAQIMRELKESLQDDIGNIMIFPFTDLNLVQISRKRRGKSIYEYMEEECPLCKGNSRLLKLSYIEELICNEIKKYSSQNGINKFLIELEECYEERVKGDIVLFLQNIDALDKEIYINYIRGVDGYRVEPLIFQNQQKNIEKYKIIL
ncbi:ribonuclease E/G [Clostridium sp. MSJ-8]|uniref:ribonuclease E/G n=1 Tax=Clostridium sp. MSJ-8 TaxID=2841510 RepID=UPI001C0F1C1D|nr:ribonuclease E/G [Clostridium sp. MSJ-8]MBU5488950.1 ribonuclease E/G [Clostridium sp. MSJ-8]